MKKNILILGILIILLSIIKVFFNTTFFNDINITIISIALTLIIIKLETNSKKNYDLNQANYDNLDFVKYLCAIIVIIVHLRPFLGLSHNLDLLFNNIIGRICVPLFFFSTGFFVSQKEKNNPDYIKNYIKKMVPLYLIWSLIYIPVLNSYIKDNILFITGYIDNLNIPFLLLIPLSIVIIPIGLITALLYTGTFYHLWYFPALLIALIVLNKWKSKHKVKTLLIISIFLLLFGATETYFGFLPSIIQKILSYYFKFFFTTRNFLFFGLFYVVFGYFVGNKKPYYVKHSLIKFIVCMGLLVAETILLQQTKRLNSNILLSCVPLVYYLFKTLVYSNSLIKSKLKHSFRELSKYYYLLHPLIIFIVEKLYLNFIIFNSKNVLLKMVIVIVMTHFMSLAIIKIKKRYPRMVI